MKNLVIVESPAKAKTIGKYLGSGYVVRACMGHLRDLPKSKIGIDFDNDFEPDYKPIKGKEEIIRDLKKLSDESEYVYLATDPDREGEAISWHLKELLGLSEEKTRRVTFNEITKKVVKESIENPRPIDNQLVDAQQARRLLDRIVGYRLSPLLWKKIRRGLSAGRVQSVAMRMVAEREDEIRAFVPKEYWTIDVGLKNEEGGFTAHFHGQRGEKQEIPDEAAADAILKAVDGKPFTVKKVKRIDKQRSPAPPFTTSTMQQDASRKLNMTPRRTMAIAQQLYEGIDIAGEGAVGLITYMRTDSLRISDEAVDAAKAFITAQYGAEFYPPQTRRFKTKGNAQDAHEAIRPSVIELTPERIKKDLTTDQYRLYRLIWSRFIACQMANAVYDSTSVEVEGAQEYTFRANYRTMKFAGFTALYEEGKDDEKEEKLSPLPALSEGQMLEKEREEKLQHFTQPPGHYTDATLIRAMEEQGIGRPSTYAPTVSTILDREYVVKEGKYLHITPLGEVVTGLMKERFSDIVDTSFTAHMEENLDSVEMGEKNWKRVLGDFYAPFADSLQNAETALEGVRLKVPDEVSQELCPVCGKNLVVKSGRFGRFLACPGYPECTFTMPLVVQMPGRCPKCGGRLMKRTGTSKKTKKQYTYYCCEYVGGRTEGHDCDFMTWDVPVADDCPACGQTMFKKPGRGAKKPYCINPECERFLPEEKRGGYRRKAENSEQPAADEESAAQSVSEEKPKKTAKKASAKKAPEKKKTAKKTAAKRTAKKSAEENSAHEEVF